MKERKRGCASVLYFHMLYWCVISLCLHNYVYLCIILFVLELCLLGRPRADLFVIKCLLWSSDVSVYSPYLLALRSFLSCRQHKFLWTIYTIKSRVSPRMYVTDPKDIVTVLMDTRDTPYRQWDIFSERFWKTTTNSLFRLVNNLD